MKEICRICLEKSGDMVNVFDNTIELGISIADMISQFTGSHISRGDPFPETICPPCLQDAKVAYQIKQRYERNQQIYSQYKEQILHEEEFLIPDFQRTRSNSGDESQEFNLQIKLEENDDNFREMEEPYEDECLVKNEAISDDVTEEGSCQIADVNIDHYVKQNHHNTASSILKSVENQIIAILKENELLRVKLDLVSKECAELAGKKGQQVRKPKVTHKKDVAPEPSKVIRFPITSLAELEHFERQFSPDLRDFYIGRICDHLARGPLSRKLNNILDEELVNKFNLKGSFGKLSLGSYKSFYDVLEAATKIVHPNEPVKNVIRKALTTIKNKMVKRKSRSRKGLQSHI